MVNGHDLHLHLRGESRFIDDLPHPEGLLHAAVLGSPIAHGRIVRLETAAAARVPGVVAVLTAKDLPGENQTGAIFHDEPLLAEREVHCVGEPLALAVAATPEAARGAIGKIQARLRPLPALFDPRRAFEKGLLIAPPRVFASGDPDRAWAECDRIVEGRVETGAQEHAYLETQGALAIPGEDGGMKIVSSTQGPAAVQRTVAKVLGLPMHRVEVEVPRLGGGFGGKEDQATTWACLAAFGAAITNRPVKLVLRRDEDMRMTGKRHPYSADFKIGVKRDGTILAYEARFFQNAGYCADLSTSILERTLFHATGSYFIPNVRVTAVSCRTNLPSNTAFRGFGAPQAMFVLEGAISRAADAIGVPRETVQAKNLLREGDRFPFGMVARRPKAEACWRKAMTLFDAKKWRRSVAEFNVRNRLRKKGLAFMPVCFGISFTNKALNQARALVHVYTDGSVSVSTGAVEMGQGVNAKIRKVAARALRIPLSLVRVENTNTTRVANPSPTAASSGADLNGQAVRIACEEIARRLRPLKAGEGKGLAWEALVRKAHSWRVSLSAQGHYATPGIGFDRKREKGTPFAYHAFGTAGVEVTLDALRGTYEIDAVRLVHDAGRSLDPGIDRGQIEGGIVQGIGWLTVEELLYAPDGKLVTANLATYKVPDIHFAPREIDVHFLPGAGNPAGLLNSKAIGEPPFMYGIGAFFALADAMKSFRPGLTLDLTAPLTPERVLKSLCPEPALYSGEKPVF